MSKFNKEQKIEIYRKWKDENISISQLSKVNVSKVYQYVKKHGGLAKVKKISQKMNLEKRIAQNNIKQNSSSSSSAQSSSSNRIVKKKDNNSEIEVTSISPALQGTWYAAGLFTEKLNSKVQIVKKN